MIVSITIFFDLLILFWIAWWMHGKTSGSMRIVFWPALVLKLLAGLAVGWIYFYYYGHGDTITYWNDGKLVAGKMISDPLKAMRFFWDDSFQWDGLINDKPRSLFFVKISGLLAFVGGGNYWMMSLIISFISFLGAWYLCLKTTRFFPEARRAVVVAFLFYPSVIFWSSGLIKESLGLAALYFLGSILLTIISNKKIFVWEYMVALASLWISWNLKYYWVGAFMPVAITTILVIFVKKLKPALVKYELSMWIILFILLLSIATSVHPNFYPNRFLEVIVANNQEFMALTDQENAILYQNLNPSLKSVLVNMPQALISGISRPFVWEAHNVISFAAGLENLVLALLVLSSIPSVPKIFKSPDRLLVLAMLTYIIILAIFLSLSTPNLGTLSRYKVGFLPFLVFLLIFQNQWIVRFFVRKKITVQ